MSFLSIIVIIIFYFIIKYLFRFGTILVLLKLAQQLQINIRKNKIKRGSKKWDSYVKNVIENLIEKQI
jgi:hypothetical protein